MDLLRSLHSAFKIGNSQDIKDGLSELKIENFTNETNKKFFVSLMKQSIKSPLGIQASKIVINRWEQMDIEGHQLATPAYFMMQTEIDMEVLQNMVDALPHWDYVNFIYAYIYWDSSPEVELALKRVDDLYGIQSQIVYKSLLRQIDDQFKQQGTYNHAVREYLVSKLESIAEYAPKPEWIINDYDDFIPDELDPTLKPPSDANFESILPSPEDAANMILQQFQFNPFVKKQMEKFQSSKSSKEEKELPEIVFNEIPILKPITSVLNQENNNKEESCPVLTKEQIKTLQDHEEEILGALSITYNNATLQSKLRLLGGVAPKISKDILGKDERLFKLYGPSNPIFGRILNDEDIKENPCCMFGGCRMLICNEFAQEDEFGYLDENSQNIEWFDGSCEFCHKKIAKKIYALRRPMTFGGWKGTFCSFKCLRDSVPLNNIHNHYIIDLVENQLKAIGIQNRIVSEKEGQINDQELKKRLRGEIKNDIKENHSQVEIKELTPNPMRKYNI